MATTSPARQLAKDLPGLDKRFSHLISVPGRGADKGRSRQWHYLDTLSSLKELGTEPVGTIVAVHGNPTWSYLWRELITESIQAAGRGNAAWRVIAVDQLEMGWSERTGITRTLTQRVVDLTGFVDALKLSGPVVSLGHDWGGVVSLGWAVDHPDMLAGVMLTNTAIHHPEGFPIPAPLRLAGARGILATSTTRSTAFLDTTLALASPGLSSDVKDAYRLPYKSAERRRGIGDFVADIPADSSHPSHSELARIAACVAELKVPALMLWGPRDPIFSDRYLDDLVDRLPHADVHRFEGAGHLVTEDRPYAASVLTWLEDNKDRLTAADAPAASLASTVATDEPSDSAFRPLWHLMDQRALDDDVAVIEMPARASEEPRRVSWRHLNDRVRRIASGLSAIGVKKSDRVSLLIPPGPTLTAVVYACLRIGAVVVVADAGLGATGLNRAIRGAWPDFIIGERRGLTAARAMRWPGVRVSATTVSAPQAAALGVSYSLVDLMKLGKTTDLPPEPGPNDTAAILFTSGSTGPAKGVVYRHRHLSALRDVLLDHFKITPEAGLVTGFAPFALLGPAFGTHSVTPNMDVSKPRTLTAKAVAEAVRESDARIVFLSPAAILNVVATKGRLMAGDRAPLEKVTMFLSTGAPISASLLESVGQLMPQASAHTPYGMTECLLVTDITLDGIRAAAGVPDTGVCVGSPMGSNQVLISALDEAGNAVGTPADTPGVLGEIVISAEHLKHHYDRLWLTDRAATHGTDTAAGQRWHRTGDVGHLDNQGRLWVEGRLAHVITTAAGPLAPVGPEQHIETVPGVRRAAVVGVGPRGLRQAVAVVETEPARRRPGIADPDLTAAVRAASSVPLVAVLVIPRHPTDIRHNSKIDRVALSDWAEDVLAGAKPRPL